MEDDVEMIQNPHLVSKRIQQLDDLCGKNGWDILFTDRDTKNQKGEYVKSKGAAKRPNFKPSDSKKFAKRKKVSRHFRKIGNRFGSYSMIVRRSGMKKILDFYRKYKIFLPYDMEYGSPEGMRLYTVNDDIVSTYINAASDNGGPNYLQD